MDVQQTITEFFKTKKENIDIPFQNLIEQVTLIETILEDESESVDVGVVKWTKQGELSHNEDSPVYITGNVLIISFQKQIKLLERQLSLYSNYLGGFKKYLDEFNVLSKAASKLALPKPKQSEKVIVTKKDEDLIVDKIKTLKNLTIDEITKKLEELGVRSIHPMEVKHLDFLPYRPGLISRNVPIQLKLSIGGGEPDKLQSENFIMKQIHEEIKSETFEEFRLRLLRFTKTELELEVWRKRIRNEMYIYYTLGEVRKRDYIVNIIRKLNQAVDRKLESRIETVRNVR